MHGRTSQQCLQRWGKALQGEVRRPSPSTSTSTHASTPHGTGYPDLSAPPPATAPTGAAAALAAHTPAAAGSSRAVERTPAAPVVGAVEMRKGRWSKDEDAQLVAAVQIFKVPQWRMIQTMVPSRTDVQCRERYVNCLLPPPPSLPPLAAV